MTVAKSTIRKRRKSTLTGIPKNIREWFSGERRFTFYAYTYPWTAHIDEYWNTWKKEHLEAVKPEGLDALIKSSKGKKKFIEKENDAQ